MEPIAGTRPPGSQPGPLLRWALPAAILLLMAGLSLSPAVVRAPAVAVHADTPVAPGPTRGSLSDPPPPPLVLASAWLANHPSPELGIQARAAVLVDLDTRQVLWERGLHDPRAPASLTKIVTVMVALDHVPMEAELTVPPEAAHLNPNNTLMGLLEGERLTVRELLYGVFLVSGNDAAETLARGIVPRDQFVFEMNVKAQRLGLAETHFTDPTGLGSRSHLSSAYDMAVAAGYFSEHYPGPAFIAGLQGVVLPAGDAHQEYRLYNLNKLLTWPYPGATGLKTGFTGRAGGCVAATASRAGHHLVVVVLGSDVFFTDAARLLDYGWTVV